MLRTVAIIASFIHLMSHNLNINTHTQRKATYIFCLTEGRVALFLSGTAVMSFIYKGTFISYPNFSTVIKYVSLQYFLQKQSSFSYQDL